MDWLAIPPHVASGTPRRCANNSLDPDHWEYLEAYAAANPVTV